MKNKLTKIYNIFKQIENMSGSVGWDQIDVFYYFYEEHQNYLACWQLLYGLFSENKTLKPTIFGITLTELRKFSDAKSVIYTFENSEEPILVATFERNVKHQVSGTVKIEDTLLTDEKEVTFIDGMNLDSEVDTNPDSSKTYKNWISYLNSNLEEVNQYNISLNLLMVKNNISFEFIKKYLIEIDKLTLQELMDLDYVEDRIETHKSYYEDVIIIEDTITGLFNIFETYFESTHWKHDEKSVAEGFESYELAAKFCKENNYNIQSNDEDEEIAEIVPTFQINGETPDGLYSLEDVRLFLDYLYDDCDLLGSFHPDDGFDNYMNNNNSSELFTKEQQELYNKYLDDIFELDADGESVFVAEGFDDAYDYVMNYRNDNYDNIKELF